MIRMRFSPLGLIALLMGIFFGRMFNPHPGVGLLGGLLIFLGVLSPVIEQVIKELRTKTP